jgi:hypothetical protein
MNAFIAIAACAILVYIVYAYNKSRVAFDNGMLWHPSKRCLPDAAAETYQPVDYLVFPARHLMTVSPRTA